ncbi:MAG: homocysteine S-methyltransferase family protein [Clostridia bacterium]|nr:homocysteine S-methyltransferase family protein [Clostridia bacterium]
MKSFSLNEQEFLLLDGATGSNLIAAGMPAGVCVEQWVLEHPTVLNNLQEAFETAGTQVLTAATFGANPQKLSSYGLENATEDLNQKLVALSRKTAKNAYVAGDVSPTGLFLPPMGTATFADLCRVYDRQISTIKEAGADLVLIETQMTLSDARAALYCANRHGLTALVTITLEQGGKTLSGLSLACAVIVLQAMGAAAIGLNCSCGPVSMASALEAARPYAKIPLIAKPNAGEPGNPLPPEEFGKAAAALANSGAAILGGCCGTTPAHIAALAENLKNYKPLPSAGVQGEFLADERRIFPIPQTIVSETFACDEELMDNVMDAEEDTNLLILTLNDPQDAQHLTDALPFCSLPLCFSSENKEALEAALQAYQGRAMIKGNGATQDLCQQYGAVILA